MRSSLPPRECRFLLLQTGLLAEMLLLVLRCWELPLSAVTLVSALIGGPAPVLPYARVPLALASPRKPARAVYPSGRPLPPRDDQDVLVLEDGSVEVGPSLELSPVVYRGPVWHVLVEHHVPDVVLLE
jgi:hypothetical protein